MKRLLRSPSARHAVRTVGISVVLVVAARAPLAAAQAHTTTVELTAPLPSASGGGDAVASPTGHPTTPVANYSIPLITAGVVALGAGITLYLAPSGQFDPAASHWRGGILFDDAARSALRFAPHDQWMAATVSDIAMVSTMMLAANDAIGVPLMQGDVNLSWQAGFAYSLTLGLTLSMGELFKRTVGRARPYEQECAGDSANPRCNTANAYESFYSLHTSVAFAAAGFSCAMHVGRSLYGDALADATSCGVSISLATLTGVMRIAADQHYLSDVIVGGLVGALIGYLIPTLLLPNRDQPAAHAAPAGPTASVAPVVAPGPGGGTYMLNVSGTF